MGVQPRLMDVGMADDDELREIKSCKLKYELSETHALRLTDLWRGLLVRGEGGGPRQPCIG